MVLGARFDSVTRPLEYDSFGFGAGLPAAANQVFEFIVRMLNGRNIFMSVSDVGFRYKPCYNVACKPLAGQRPRDKQIHVYYHVYVGTRDEINGFQFG
jgi:hypothetical protein